MDLASVLLRYRPVAYADHPILLIDFLARQTGSVQAFASMCRFGTLFEITTSPSDLFEVTWNLDYITIQRIGDDWRR